MGMDDKTYSISITAEIQTVEKISKQIINKWNKWASLVLIEAQIKYTSFKLLTVW